MGSAEVQGPLWGRHPEIWSTTLEQKMRPLYIATLEALQPLAGKTLLDAGCGASQAARNAASRGATVSGLDASAPLLDVARQRTPSGDFRQGDIEASVAALPRCRGAESAREWWAATESNHRPLRCQ